MESVVNLCPFNDFQLINFFLINKSFYFVDLPGYGFAKVPLAVKKKWGPMIETYLSQRSTLKGVVLLIDIRRMPGIEDSNLVAWLAQYGIALLPVLTKADKLSKTNQKKQRQAIASALGLTADRLILFSAKSRQGKEALWEQIEIALESAAASDEQRGELK